MRRYGFTVVLMTTSLDWCAPEACSLPLADQPARVAEWDDLLSGSVRAMTEVPGGLRLELDRTPSVCVQLTDLAERESRCCSFLTFTITVSSDALRLDVTAESGYEKVAAAMARRIDALRADVDARRRSTGADGLMTPR